MERIRQHKFFRVLWMVMALHILNFSVDAPDVNNDEILEDLSYNDIESFTEWFAEDVLNIENAFTESDEPGKEDSGFVKKVSDITFYQVHFEKEIIPMLLSNIKNNSTNVHYSEPFCATNYISIFSPPPEA